MAKPYKRLAAIAQALLKEELGYYADLLKLRSYLPFYKRFSQPKHAEPHPERIRKVLESLCGGFVKLGQLLSLRPDLIPIAYCEEFAKLQDQVPPVSFSQVKTIVEKEIGKPLRHVFSKFDPKPLGSASIAQVHAAKMIEGKEVVVKVQRPGIKEIFEADIEALYFIAHRLQHFFKDLPINPVQIVEEFEHYTQEELNFTIEAKHIQKFYRLYGSKDYLTIPRCFPTYCTERVLVMQHLHGVKLSQLLKQKKKMDPDIAEALFDFTVEQVFQKDIFHADLHPGNILVLPHGKIGILDFGITGTLTQQEQEQSLRMFIGILDKDAEEVHEALIQVSHATESTDLAGLKEDIEEILHEWHGPMKNMTHTLYLLFEKCRARNLQLPSNLVVLGKALLAVEGTCLQINPSFDIADISKPYLVKLLKKEFLRSTSLKNLLKKSFSLKEYVDTIPGQMRSALRTLEKGSFKIDIEDMDIFNLGRTFAVAGNRIALGFLGGGLFIGGALLMQANPPPFLWGYPVFGLIALSMGFILLLMLCGTFFS